MISGHTRVFALIGHPVEHSLSPALYNPQFEADGVDAVYVALDVHPDQAMQVGHMIRHMGLAGANLTVPFKAAVLSSLDRVDPLARLLKAVNTVVWEDGQLVGYNTDAPGFVEGLRADLGVDPKGMKVVVLGAGGAGRAVGMGLAAAGAAEVTWLNRTSVTAEQTARRCGEAYTGVTCHGAPLSRAAWEIAAAEADLVVQCTSGSGVMLVNELSLEPLASGAIWADINYWMDAPPHVEALRQAGHRIHLGHHMLAWQAVRAYGHFTGLHPDAAAFVARLG